MSETATLDDLLAVCVQDLHAGCAAAADRLPGVAACAHDAALSAEMDGLIASAGRRADRLASLGLDLSGPANLWMGGILDDAERDTGSIVRGPLLDIAMIGAARKAIAAERVSVDTAVAVARATGRDDAVRACDVNVAELDRLDEALRSALARQLR